MIPQENCNEQQTRLGFEPLAPHLARWVAEKTDVYSTIGIFFTGNQDSQNQHYDVRRSGLIMFSQEQ